LYDEKGNLTLEYETKIKEAKIYIDAYHPGRCG
jgi:hypothetical protein